MLMKRIFLLSLFTFSVIAIHAQDVPSTLRSDHLVPRYRPVFHIKSPDQFKRSLPSMSTDEISKQLSMYEKLLTDARNNNNGAQGYRYNTEKFAPAIEADIRLMRKELRNRDVVSTSGGGIRDIKAKDFLEPANAVGFTASSYAEKERAQQRAEVMKNKGTATKKGYVSPEKNILGQNTKSDNPVKLTAKDFSKEKKSMPRGCVLPQNGTGHPNSGNRPLSGHMVPRRPMSADKIRQNYPNRNQANIHAHQFPSTFDLIPTPSNGLKDNSPKNSHMIFVFPGEPSVEPDVISTVNLVKPYNSKPTNYNNKQGGPYSSDFEAVNLEKWKKQELERLKRKELLGDDGTTIKIEEAPPGQIDQGYFKKPEGMVIKNVGNNNMSISSKGKARSSYKTGRPDGLVQGGSDNAPNSDRYKVMRAINQPF